MEKHNPAQNAELDFTGFRRGDWWDFKAPEDDSSSFWI
jgi:hypothetical protein